MTDKSDLSEAETQAAFELLKTKIPEVVERVRQSRPRPAATVETELQAAKTRYKELGKKSMAMSGNAVSDGRTTNEKHEYGELQKRIAKLQQLESLQAELSNGTARSSGVAPQTEARVQALRKDLDIP